MIADWLASLLWPIFLLTMVICEVMLCVGFCVGLFGLLIWTYHEMGL